MESLFLGNKNAKCAYYWEKQRQNKTYFFLHEYSASQKLLNPLMPGGNKKVTHT